MKYLIWIIGVCVVVLIWTRINKRLFNDAFSPFNLLLPAWILPLMLKSLNLSAYEKPWSAETITIIVWTTCSLTLSSLCTAAFLKTKTDFRNNSAFLRTLGLFKDESLFKKLILCWFVVGFWGFLYNDFITNEVGIPIIAFLENPEMSRDAYWLSKGAGWLWPLAVPALVCVPMLYLCYKTAKPASHRLFFLSLTMVYPILGVVKMSRSDIVYSVTGIVMAEYYYRRYVHGRTAAPGSAFKRFGKRILLFCLVLLAFMISATVFQEVRGGRDMAKYSLVLGVSPDLPEPLDAVVIEVYGYFALPFENLSNFVNANPSDYHFGVGLVRPVLSLLGQGKLAKEEIQDMDWAMELLPINTFPFVTTLYAESGWIGVIFGPLIYSLLVNWIYVRFRRSQTFVNIIMYIMCPYSWLWIATNSNFTGIIFYFYLAFPYFLYFQYRCIAKPVTLLGPQSPRGRVTQSNAYGKA